MTETQEPSGRCLRSFRSLGVILVGGNLAQMVLLVVLFPFFKGDVPGGGPPRISYLLHAASALILFAGRPLLVTAASRYGFQRAERAGLEFDAVRMRSYQFRLVADYAMLQLLFWISLTSYLVEHQIWTIIVATIMICLQVTRYPTNERAERLLYPGQIRNTPPRLG